MSEDSSTPVSKDAAVKKGGVHRFCGFGHYFIMEILCRQ